MMKKCCLLLAMLFVLSVVCCSCGHVGTGEEVLAAARTLLLPANKLCTWYFEKAGIPAMEGSASSGKYAPADPAFLAEQGITGTDSLREKNRAVYSRALCEYLEERIFSSQRTEGGTVLHYVRYYDSNGTLMVDTAPDAPVKGHDHVHLSTLRVVSIGSNEAVVAVDLSVEYDGMVQEMPGAELRLVYEDGAWRLDSFPYLTFDEGRDF